MATASAAPSSGSVAEPIVEQNQRIRGGGARDEIDVGNVRGKGREILFDRLVVADIG